MEIETNVSKYLVENLPFTVRIVRSPDDLMRVAELRNKAYARHVPEFAKRLAVPEPEDTISDVFVLLVESKNNAGGAKPLGQ